MKRSTKILNGFEYLSVCGAPTKTHRMCHLNGNERVMKFVRSERWTLTGITDFYVLIVWSMPIHLRGYKIFVMLFCICTRKYNNKIIACDIYEAYCIISVSTANKRKKNRARIRKTICLCVQCSKIWICFASSTGDRKNCSQPLDSG